MLLCYSLEVFLTAVGVDLDLCEVVGTAAGDNQGAPTNPGRNVSLWWSSGRDEEEYQNDLICADNVREVFKPERMDGGSYCVHGDGVTGIDIGIDICGIEIGTGGLMERLCVLEGIGGEARESESEATILVGGGLAPGPGGRTVGKSLWQSRLQTARTCQTSVQTGIG